MILEVFKRKEKQIVGFIKLSILAVNSRAIAAKFVEKVVERREKVMNGSRLKELPVWYVNSSC